MSNYFTDYERIYTWKELEAQGLMQDDPQYRKIDHAEGFRFIGFKGNLNNHLPCKNLIDAGVIHGHQMIHKFGRAVGPANGQWSNVWNGGGMIPFTGLNLVAPTIVSTGADTVDIQIKGVKLENGDWNIATYTITLTGTTPVVIPGDIMSVYRMTNVGAVDLVGDVTLQDGATVYAKIVAGPYNSTQMAWMPIPTGYVGMPVKFGASIDTGKAAQIAYRYRAFGQVARLAMIFDISGQKISGDVEYSFDEKTILDAICKPTIAGTDVSANFDVILIEKPLFEQLYGEFKEHNNIS